MEKQRKPSAAAVWGNEVFPRTKPRRLLFYEKTAKAERSNEVFPRTKPRRLLFYEKTAKKSS